MKRFKDIHQGQRAFVIGNGPSINDMNLTLLRDEVTIGCNRIYKNNKIIPGYYCIEDRKLASRIKKEINAWGRDVIKFIASDIARFLKVHRNVISVPFVRGRKLKGVYKFSDDCSKVVYWGSSVTFMMLQIAYYFGCNPIYLIGMDGIRKDKPKHFYPQDKVKNNPPRYHISDVAMRVAVEFFREHNITVLDATPDPVRPFFPPTTYKELF